MRHPIDTLPRQFDPWAFARARRSCGGALPLSATHALKQWASGGEALHCTLDGNIDQYGQTHLAGHVSVLLQMQCQRCLRPMQQAVEHDFDYVIIRDPALEDRVEGDSEILVCAEDDFDVAWFLEEEVLLAMPMIAKHDDCKMPLDLRATPQEVGNERQHPFAALKEIMESKEH